MSTIAWWVAGLVGLAAIVWLASKWGAAKSEKVIAEHMGEAVENAAKMRADAEAAVRRSGDGTVSDGLRDWLRD